MHDDQRHTDVSTVLQEQDDAGVTVQAQLFPASADDNDDVCFNCT